MIRGPMFHWIDRIDAFDISKPAALTKVSRENMAVNGKHKGER